MSNTTPITIRNAEGIFTGLPGDAVRAHGSIRIVQNRIEAIGDVAPPACDRIIDAKGCVIYPGLISTTTTCCNPS